VHQDRLLPADPSHRALARQLYEQTAELPIVSPHGHCDPAPLGSDGALGDPALELVTRDHYILRMLYSQGVSLESLGVLRVDGTPVESQSRNVWRLLGEHYGLFRGTPSKLWLDYTLSEVLGIDDPLSARTADEIYDEVCARLSEDAYSARSLYDRFGIEFLATTDGATASLDTHESIRRSGWHGRVVPTFRPDDVIDPERAGFAERLGVLATVTDSDVGSWKGYLEALRRRRLEFRAAGATATDHGHPSPVTADLGQTAKEELFSRVVAGPVEVADAELFRAQMLTEMAAMSLDDGLVMQLHVGSWRNHNPLVYRRFGPDKGADIPRRADFVHSLKPLLDRFGNERSLTVILYTLDETTYGRELAPLAGHYPALRLGPPWWFYDSTEGMHRYYRSVIETAGFANTVGFNDDARSLLTIKARHDVARRVNASYLAGLVLEHRLDEDDAVALAHDLASTLSRRAFRVAE
jgi:glucuronate isomerase